MGRFFSVLFLMVAVARGLAQNTDSNIVDFHFVGAAELLRQAPKIREASSTTNFPAFRTQVLDNLSQAFVRLASGKGQYGSNARLLRPLLEDFLDSESTGHWDGHGGYLAIKSTRAEAWDTNLREFCQSAGSKAESSTAKGEWQAKGLLRFSRAHDWVLLEFGDARSNFSPPARPSSLLQARIDSGQLNRIFGAHIPVKPAIFDISITPRGNDLRTVIRAKFRQPFSWSSIPWKIPTRLIRDPLVSFTASQNLSAFLEEFPLFRRAGINPFERQLFFAAQDGEPFQSLMAIQVPNAAGAFADLSARLPKEFNATLTTRHSGFLAVTNNYLTWQRWPVLLPFLRAETNGPGEFLVGGLFPRPGQTNPPPAELFSQVNGRTNLVYYDWEVTGPRLAQWSIMNQLRIMALNPPLVRDDAKTVPVVNPFANKWMLDLSDKLQNAITEVSRTDPSTLTLTRKSPVGLTAVELLALTRWLLNPDFPHVPEPALTPPTSTRPL